jgi:hypothetical protein
MSRHALRIATPTRSHGAQLLRSWTKQSQVLHVGAADEVVRAAWNEAGFTLTVVSTVDDLDITLPAGTCFEAIVVGSATLSSCDSLRAQIRLLWLVSDHLTPDGVALVEVDDTSTGTPHDRAEARHGAHVHIADELDLIAEMAGLRRAHRSNSGEDTRQATTVSLYQRKRS